MKQILMVEYKITMLLFTLAPALIVLQGIFQMGYEYLDNNIDQLDIVVMHIFVAQALTIILAQHLLVVLTALNEYILYTTLTFFTPFSVAAYAVVISYSVWDLHRKHVLKPLIAEEFPRHPWFMLWILGVIFISISTLASSTQLDGHVIILTCYLLVILVLGGKIRYDASIARRSMLAPN